MVQELLQVYCLMLVTADQRARDSNLVTFGDLPIPGCHCWWSLPQQLHRNCQSLSFPSFLCNLIRAQSIIRCVMWDCCPKYSILTVSLGPGFEVTCFECLIALDCGHPLLCPCLIKTSCHLRSYFDAFARQNHWSSFLFSYRASARQTLGTSSQLWWLGTPWREIGG